VRIVEATNRQAVRELLSPQRVRDIETDRRVAAIVADVREHGDDALLRYARSFDGLESEAEISRKEARSSAVLLLFP
jgi:histidinol dehydrogenase